MSSVAIGKGHLKLLYNANGGLYQYSNGKNSVIFPSSIFLYYCWFKSLHLCCSLTFLYFPQKVNVGIGQTYKFYSGFNGSSGDSQVNFVIFINFVVVSYNLFNLVELVLLKKSITYALQSQVPGAGLKFFISTCLA